MRRVTVHKTVAKSVARRVREERQAVERLPRERTEVRGDVRRVWWPDE
ncbi:hypothetical protein ABZ626_25685 [Streptomyces longispororuber]|uniref:Uncharacterized protein n=1 Tax=Streptomyces longispororuber TaxID=68230 RepID=A0A918ZWG8_9ACTN|nr:MULTISPECIES: hypothetical protein [Streptomyces]GHE71242.1 hypothetical protein GCM10018785_44480 [Streptomyces longispororuber]